MMKSLRTRLLVGMFGSIAVVLSLFSLVIYITINRAIREEFDFALDKLARTLAAAALVEKGVIEVELAPEMLPEFQETEHPLFFQYWVEGGKVLDRSGSLAGSDLTEFYGPTEEPVFRDIQLPNGKQGRAAGIRFRPGIEYPRERPQGAIRTDDVPMVTVVVARDRFNLHSRQAQLRWLLTGSGLATLVIGCFVSAIIIDRGLSPLRKLARRIAAIEENDLTARVTTTNLPREVAPVARRLNDLLARLQRAFDRERCFTADVAHEFRTPLAAIRSTIEVMRSTDRSPEEYKEALDDTLSVTKRLQKLVKYLLILARMDFGRASFRPEQNCVSEVVDACWQPHQDAAQARGLVFENRVPADLSLSIDANCLITVLNNLLENSVEYTDPGGSVWVTSNQSNGSVEISVSNTGCRIEPNQIDHVFERFWRGDPSRTGSDGHCGLGMSLVQRLVRSLGGYCSATVDEQAVFTVQVGWPQSNQAGINLSAPTERGHDIGDIVSLK